MFQNIQLNRRVNVHDMSIVTDENMATQKHFTSQSTSTADFVTKKDAIVEASINFDDNNDQEL